MERANLCDNIFAIYNFDLTIQICFVHWKKRKKGHYCFSSQEIPAIFFYKFLRTFVSTYMILYLYIFFGKIRLRVKNWRSRGSWFVAFGVQVEAVALKVGPLELEIIKLCCAILFDNLFHEIKKKTYSKVWNILW